MPRILLLFLMLMACQRPPVPLQKPMKLPPPPPQESEIPQISPNLQIDGELGETPWRLALRTGPFLDAQGQLAIPHSEALLAHDGQRLLLGLYAADENLQAAVTQTDAPLWADDTFQVRLQKLPTGPVYALDVSVTGVLTDARVDVRGQAEVAWQSGAQVAVDRDGTLNDPHDDDEEWVVELAVPLRNLGIQRGDRLAITLLRCDTPKDGRRRCGSWKREMRVGR